MARELEAEHDNMRLLSLGLERKEAEVALRLGGALSWFWSMRVTTARADAGSKRRWQWKGEDRLRCGRWHWPG